MFNTFVDTVDKHIQGKNTGRISKAEQQAQED